MLFLLFACEAPPDTGKPAGHDSGDDSPTDSDTAIETPATPELWVYASHNLQVDENVTALEALMDRAAAAGYHGFVLADFKFNLLGTGLLSEAYEPNLQEVQDHAAGLGLALVPAILPFGYSEGIYYQHPDWAEGEAVVGAQFQVSADGARLDFVPEATAFEDGGFEAHSGDSFTSWDWQDEGRTFADTSVAHSGAASLRIDAGAGNARVVQAVKLQPHREYHLRYFMRTSASSGAWVNAEVLDATTGRALNYQLGTVSSDQDWTQYDATFNSMDTTDANLYVGAWGDMSGTLWVDDVSLEETALVNLIRRDGAPLVLTGPAGALTEGADFDTISDPAIQTAFDNWHEPPVVTLPGGTSLRPGDSVTADFYAVTLIYDYQVGACLSEGAITSWMESNVAEVDAAFPTSPGIFLSYDEMRQLNSCDACASRGLSAGEILADHVRTSADIVRSRRPDAELYYWSDMFDPNHNAVDEYYHAYGDIAGSWEGLPSDAVIFNWNLGSTASATWFESLGMRQVVAGYYDSGDGDGSARTELGAVAGVVGVQGMMYTTWADDYGQLETYAAAAFDAWPP